MKYPKKVGVCLLCHKDIIAKNGGFDKPTREFCSKSCKASTENKKRVWKQESKDKIAKANAINSKGRLVSYKTRLKLSIINQGENHWNWKGGISPKNASSRSCIELKEWRRQVFARDDYRCFDCGVRNGEGKSVILHADHILPYALFPRLRFDINNGRTLCKECHKKTDTYAGRMNAYKYNNGAKF